LITAIYIANAHAFIDDAAKMSSSVRDHLPGREKEAKTEAKLIGQQAGTQIDSAVSSGTKQNPPSA